MFKIALFRLIKKYTYLVLLCSNLSMIVLIVFLSGVFNIPILAATITDNTSLNFNAGTFSGTVWNGMDGLEMTSASQTLGVGTYTSSIKDVLDNSSWTSIS